MKCSPKTHFVIHHLMYRAFPKDKCMISAFFGMCNGWGHYGFRITAKEYGVIREKRNKSISLFQSGENHPCFGKFGENHQRYGKKMTAEQKVEFAASLKGRKHSEESNEKRRTKMKGRKQSEETKAKRSASLTGRTAWNKGMNQSNETKAKRSASLTGMKGITNGTRRKRVHPEQLESFLNDGWSLISKT